MADLATYIPEEVTVLLAGLIPIEGFVQDTFVSAVKDIMPYAATRSPDGSMDRLYENDQTYTLLLTIYSATTSNDLLTKLWQLDEITQRGKFPIFVKDSSGTSLFFSPTAWIEALPPLEFSNSLGYRTWSIRCAQSSINFGNNVNESGLVEDLINLATSALPGLQGLV